MQTYIIRCICCSSMMTRGYGLNVRDLQDWEIHDQLIQSLFILLECLVAMANFIGLLVKVYINHLRICVMKLFIFPSTAILHDQHGYICESNMNDIFYVDSNNKYMWLTNSYIENSKILGRFEKIHSNETARNYSIFDYFFKCLSSNGKFYWCNENWFDYAIDL